MLTGVSLSNEAGPPPAPFATYGCVEADRISPGSPARSRPGTGTRRIVASHSRDAATDRAAGTSRSPEPTDTRNGYRRPVKRCTPKGTRIKEPGSSHVAQSRLG